MKHPRIALIAATLAATLALGGCAHFNTFYNASKSFRQAEQDREKQIKAGQDVSQPTANAKKLYEAAITKSQKILDEYPGSGMTDDALFLMGKAYYRLQSYRMSIAKLDLLFANFPSSKYEEEALFLQAVDHLFIHDVAGSTTYIETLQNKYPKSRYQSQTLRMRADNSFALKEWPDAREYYGQYVDRYPQAEDVAEAGYKLGQCLFELKAYDEAIKRLQPITADVAHRELAFDARLLMARSLTRLDRYADADREIATLKPLAETNKAQGDVAIAEAENLLAQGKPEVAGPLLENMPQEWKTPVVSTRVSDLLGRTYVQQWRLEDAGKQLREAIKNTSSLPDAAGTRTLSNSLQEYLAADLALPGAKPDRAAALKLTKANSLLFGLARPRRALELYLEVAGSADADSATMARALYGAVLVYRDRLSQPDSAGPFLAQLQQKYPNSAQAFVARSGKEGNLFAHLKDQHDQLARAKALADSSLARGRAPAGTGGLSPALSAPAGAAPAASSAGLQASGASPAALPDSLGSPLPATTAPASASPATITPATAPPAAPAAADTAKARAPAPPGSAAAPDTTKARAPAPAVPPSPARPDTTKAPVVPPAPAAPDTAGGSRGGGG